jgi:outer membrane receptor protein involved in Fe transport
MDRTILRARGALFGAAAFAALVSGHPVALWAEPANDAVGVVTTQATSEAVESTSQAQVHPDRESPQGIEEITVTARRRQEGIQSTPVAITAFTESDLESRGIQSITEITQSTPNLQFDSTAGSDSNARIFIRGVGQGDAIFTADPGVGLYVDGVSYTRAAGSIFDLVDIERIEVLRGPQGALYGKSTIGGAINVITRKPDGGLGGSLRAAIGEDHRRDGRLQLGLPLIGERLLGRISLSTRNTDGIALDAGRDEHLQDEAKLSGRASLRWLATDDLDVTLSFDRVRQREESIAFKLRGVNEDNNLVSVSNLLGADFGAGLQVRDPFVIATDTPSRDDLDVYGLSMNAEYSLGDGALGSDVRLQSITAWRKLEQDVNFDIDGTASGGINQINSAQQRQFSQEIRLLGSALDDKLDWGFGAFYFREDGEDTQRSEVFPTASQAVRDTRTFIRCRSGGLIDFDAESDIFQDPDASAAEQAAAVERVQTFLGRLQGGAAPTQTLQARRADLQAQAAACAGVVNPEKLSILLAPGTATAPANATGRATSILSIPGDNIRSTNNEILNTNYATYAYASYRITDDLSLEVAGRYNYEIKELFRNQILVPSGQALIDNARVDQTFRDFSPQASLSWQIDDGMLGFFRVARGFKSGGFNGRAARVRQGRVNSQEAKGLLQPYDPEILTSFELGYKSTWLERRFILNTTAFYNLYDDIQQQRLGQDEAGQPTILIDNAAKAIIQGLEIEMTALFPTQTVLSVGASLTSARFTEFPNAISNPNFDSMNSRSGPRAFSGTDLHPANTPLVTANASLSQEINLSWGTLTPRLDYSMRTRSFNNVRNSDRTRSNKVGVFNARVSFALHDAKWSVALVCRNVFDREYLVNGVDLLDAFGFASGQFGPPRDFYIEASYRF